MAEIDSLTDELAEIYRQKQEVEERLSTRFSGRGRGRGPGRGSYDSGPGRGSYQRPPEGSQAWDRAAPEQGPGYGRQRAAPELGYDQDRPPREAGHSRDRLPLPPAPDRRERQPDAAYSRDQPGGGLSARLQDRRSGMRPSAGGAEPSTSYPSHRDDRQDRYRDSRDRRPEPRDRHPEAGELPPDGSRDYRDRSGPMHNRLGDSRGRLREPYGSAGPPADSFRAPKIMSAVVVNGETRMPVQHAEPDRARPEPGIAKRPRETADSDNPAAAKRNRRMFAGLLGTLQKFKAEDEKYSQSKAAQQRAEALQRAQEQAAENERNAKQAAREAFQRQRREEINKKQELDMLARCKKLEIGLASRTAHHQKLFNFLKTAAGPPVLWLPAFVSAGMQQLLDARSGEFVSWQEEQKAELKAQTDQMAAAFQERAARMAARPAAPEAKPADKPKAEADGKAEAEAEADEAMDGDDADDAEGDQDPDAAAAAEAELEAGGSPVPVQAQDAMDEDDRYVTGQPGEEDAAMENGEGTLAEEEREAVV